MDDSETENFQLSSALEKELIQYNALEFYDEELYQFLVHLEKIIRLRRIARRTPSRYDFDLARFSQLIHLCRFNLKELKEIARLLRISNYEDAAGRYLRTGEPSDAKAYRAYD